MDNIKDLIQEQDEELRQLDEQIKNDIFVEDLGNLRQIEVGLMDPFKTRDNRPGKEKKRTKGVRYKQRYTLQRGLGRGSEISTRIIRSGKQALQTVLGGSAKGAVLMVEDKEDMGGAQLLSFAKDVGSGPPSEDGSYRDQRSFRGTGGFNLAFNMQELNRIFGEDAEAVFAILRQKTGHTFNADRHSDFAYERDVKENALYMSLTKILKLIKQSGFDPVFLVVEEDKERASRRMSRAAARRGMEVKPGSYGQPGDSWDIERGRTDSSGMIFTKNTREYDDYMRVLKNAFNHRVEEYKNSLAHGSVTLEGVFSHIKSAGFIDKIKLGGIVYNKQRTRLDLEDVLNPGESRFGTKNNYVEYEADSHSPEMVEAFRAYSKARSEIRDIMNGIEDEESEEFKRLEAEYEGLSSKMMPPSRFKIVMKAEGASIVPDEIISDRDPKYHQ